MLREVRSVTEFESKQKANIPSFEDDITATSCILEDLQGNHPSFNFEVAYSSYIATTSTQEHCNMKASCNETELDLEEASLLG